MNTTTKIETRTNQQTGAEAIVSTLTENGIDTVFGYPGSPMLSIYDALSKTNSIRHILTRHEQGAVHAAEGWANTNGKCGVVLATSGAGFTNTITGICNAYADKTPLVVITCQTETIGTNEFQEVDIQNITKTFTKKTYIITKAEDTSKIITKAIEQAAKIPMGPVVVGITKKALEESTEQKAHKKFHEIKVEAPHSCILKVIDSVKNAKRPIIIVGGGCKGAESEIIKLQNITHAPIVHTLMGKGIADNISHGMIGYNGTGYLNTCIKDADLVLALGVKFSDRTTNYEPEFLPNSRIININIEPNKSKNIIIDKELLGEMKVVLQHMIGTIQAKKILFEIHYSWIDKLSKNELLETDSNDDFTEENILKLIHKYTKKYNPIITTDVGEHQINALKIFKTTSSDHFLTSGGFGTMGYGLPAAIGAYIAKPDTLIINITGDGSFQMNLQELGTCMEYNIPIKIILLNNSSLGMIRTQQIAKRYTTYQSELKNPEFQKLAEAYGIKGYTITNLFELKKALEEIFVCKETILLDIQIS